MKLNDFDFNNYLGKKQSDPFNCAVPPAIELFFKEKKKKKEKANERN